MQNTGGVKNYHSVVDVKVRQEYRISSLLSKWEQRLYFLKRSLTCRHEMNILQILLRLQPWICHRSWLRSTSRRKEPCWGGTPQCPTSTITCWLSRTTKVSCDDVFFWNWLTNHTEATSWLAHLLRSSGFVYWLRPSCATKMLWIPANMYWPLPWANWKFQRTNLTELS